MRQNADVQTCDFHIVFCIYPNDSAKFPLLLFLSILGSKNVFCSAQYKTSPPLMIDVHLKALTAAADKFDQVRPGGRCTAYLEHYVTFQCTSEPIMYQHPIPPSINLSYFILLSFTFWTHYIIWFLPSAYNSRFMPVTVWNFCVQLSRHTAVYVNSHSPLKPKLV
jgi:hypothetical protein